MTKLPEELHHILGEVAHPCSAFCGIGELGSYVVGLINSLACTERAFDLISLPHGPVHRGLPFRAWRFLGRPAKRLRVALDFQVFQNIPVRLVHVDLVRMDGGWQVAPTLHVFVNVQLQVNTLIVCIPAVMVDEVVALYDAHAYLCPKLDAGSSLPLTMGRRCGWKMLMIRSGHWWTPFLNMSFCWWYILMMAVKTFFS